jgi:hypothetical protein
MYFYSTHTRRNFGGGGKVTQFVIEWEELQRGGTGKEKTFGKEWRGGVSRKRRLWHWWWC